MDKLFEIDCHLKWLVTYKRVLSFKNLPKAHKRIAYKGLKSCVAWLVAHGVTDLSFIDSSLTRVTCRVDSLPYSLEVR